MESITNTASTVASAASKAIWGDPAKDNTTNETGGKEPVAGEIGDVKSGEPYDKGNDEPKSIGTETSTSEPKSLTKSTSTEIPSADSTADLPSTSKIAGASNLTSPSGALDTAQIEPLKDQKEDPSQVGTGASLSGAPHVKTGAETTSTEAGAKEISLKEYEGKSQDPLSKKENTTTSVPAATSSSTTTASKVSPSTSDTKEKDRKPSLKEKIKAKLHKH